jgi:hypothetical protein
MEKEQKVFLKLVDKNKEFLAREKVIYADFHAYSENKSGIE